MDHAEMIKEIAEVASDVLNEWECDFIENMMGKTSFSSKQAAMIEKLYEKVCDSPL